MNALLPPTSHPDTPDTPPMANSTATPLEVQPVTPEDIPTLSAIFAETFNSPHDQVMFPDTPGIRSWWDEANLHDLLHKPGVRYVKVVDPAAPSVILAYSKWDFDPAARGDRFPTWHADSNASECDAFFAGCERARQAIMHDQTYYYLDMLGTHPNFRRRGAASLMLRWGCQQADEAGLPIYIDSSEDGVPVYEKLGFQVLSSPVGAPEGITPMLRQPQPKSNA